MTPKEQVEQELLLQDACKSYEKGLKLYALFKINNITICRDLVQDTFIKAWYYISKGKKIKKMKTFLYHVLNNLIIDQYRKYKTLSLDVLIEKGFEPKFGDTDYIASFADKLDNKNILRLVQRLPECYREIIKMRFIDDLSLKEIAELTGESTNCITVKVHRGLKKLRVIYDSFKAEAKPNATS